MNEEITPPPPDRWARMAAEDQSKQKRRDRRWLLMLLLVVVALAFFIRARYVENERRRQWRIEREIFNNLRQIGMVLMEFENEYGKFPDASTIVEVKKQTGTSLTLSDASSNDLFKQLLALKLIEQEYLFGVSGMYSKWPDGLHDSDATALTAGECHLAYVIGPSIAIDPCRPLAFGPIRPGTRALDPEMIEGKMVVLFTDNSVKSCRMDPTGMIWINGTAFDLSHPAWNGKPLEIKWPK
jgi:hypothetical protein